MISSNIHVGENQSCAVTVSQISDKECINIIFGKKLSDNYITHDATLSVFLTLGQLMDFYYQLDAEIERLGIDA